MEFTGDPLLNWVQEFLESKYRAATFLGAGAAGYAFLLPNNWVLKVTWDLAEVWCVDYLVKHALWEVTPHLPIIREIGSLFVPPQLQRHADLLLTTKGFEESLLEDLPLFYIREYLEPLHSAILQNQVSAEEAIAQQNNLEKALDALGIMLK